MRLRRFLARHEAEIGRPLSVLHNRYGWGTVLLVGLVWIAICGLFLLHPDFSALQKVAACGISGLAGLAVLLLTAGEVLVVCERGMVFGPSGPLRRPFVVTYGQITVGSMVPVHRSRLYPRTTGKFGRTSTIRNPAWVNHGLHFVGPSPQEAGRPGSSFSTRGARSIDDRCIWFVGTGKTPPEQVTAMIAQAARAAGWRQFASATAAARPRELTGRRGDAPRLLPGYRA